MMTLAQAQKIDIILNCIVTGNKGRKYRETDLAYILKMSCEEIDDLLNLLNYDVEFENNQVLNFQSSKIGFQVCENYQTVKFIKAGGCVEWLNYQNQIRSQFKEREELEITNLKLAIKNSKSSIIISTISIVIALLALLWSIFQDRISVLLFGI